MKKIIVGAIALHIGAHTWADTEDVLIGAGAATAVVGTVASVAAPAVVAHSSGAAIMYSGAGYVAGTIGAAAGTVVLLPAIAIGGALLATGAVIYKYNDEIEGYWTEYFNSDATESPTK